jgi:hypothetical protein
MRNRTISALSILALALDSDRDYRFAETKQKQSGNTAQDNT